MKRLDNRELKPELLSSAALNFAAAEDSSARQEMLGSHLSQCLVIDGASDRRCLTGMERVFGTGTFNIKLPCNAEIKGIVEKYPRTVGIDGIKLNPLTSVVYENIERGIIDVIDIPYYHCKHNHYGFRYKWTDAGENLTTGMTRAIPKDTILADSPNIDRHGNYKYGTELNVAFMSIPGTIEDGVVIAESVINKLTSTGYEKRHGSWGRRCYPLNLYGNAEQYKPFPDVGDAVREDGLLYAFREYDDLLGGVEMAIDQLCEIDHIFDKRVFAIPNAKVVDVIARKGTTITSPKTPTGMETQAEKYHQKQSAYYKELQKLVDGLRRRSSYSVAPKLHRLLVEGHTFNNDVGKIRPRQMYNLQELDEYRIDISFEYKVRPNIGSKLTGLHGNKGVICSIWADDDMPVDQWGTRAEIIMDGNSIIKRLNPGVLYEQYFNAQSDQMRRRLRAMKANHADTFYTEAWDLMLRYYRIVSPWTADILESAEYKGSPKRHIDSILKSGVYHWFPTDGPTTLFQSVKQLRKEYPLEKGPITYRGRSGNVITTRRDVIIASTYFILLEKVGDEWSGVSSTKLQHFGIPAKINKHDKYSTPARPMPVRILGESEVRLMVAACGSAPVSDLVEMSNSPQLHKHIVGNILKAKKPTRIESTVTDKNLIGRGGRNLAFAHHALEVSGVRFKRGKASSNEPTVYPPESGEPSL